MPRPKREDQIDLANEVKTVAYRQIAANGAAALSLRAIARELNVTAPAIYNYYSRRDDLVTALIVDSYNSFANALELARDKVGEADYAGQLMGALVAYRAWALAHPEEYSLIFGTPIPGYQAPMELTLPAAKRGMDTIIGILEAAEIAGALTFAPSIASLAPSLREAALTWKREHGYAASIQVLYLALAGWGRIHGLVMLEIYNHLAPFFYDVDALYLAEVDAILHLAGLDKGE
ncbi:MAG: TetR/AcrR family transcriptional regulator [Ardenticatenaceae bacterium]|nr:TetR/AcrR family transcriptional regulator [Anaerolineales bacterium]MCB8923789.1 TetR/AcrR family transcriptional regulator [Ardenticatenaceae bacterium]MCB8990124.1 TetR/AcrR family transcriptional regulator [Ardenticatenaceae bacterium]